ncbi:MAG: gliding motility-associated C-terminal domain-containing protein, partial [Bacteroidota bacterium]
YTPAFGCPIIEPFEITSEGLLEIDTDSLRVCLGDSAQLSATFRLNGPPVPVTFSWDPGIAINDPTLPNPTVAPRQTTTYFVTASTLTCSFTDSVLVVVDSLPILAPIADESICEGDSVQLLVSGQNIGQGIYRWSPVIGLDDPTSPRPIASPIQTTTYQVIVDNSCSSDTQTVTVTVFDPLFATTSVVDVSCTGDADGSLTAVLSGGAGSPYNYDWAPGGGTGPRIDNLPAGTYTLIVNDQANCRDTITAVVSEPPLLVLNPVDSLDIACTGDFTGMIEVAGSGGTPDYEYSIDGIAWFASGRFENLGTGSYTLQVRDQNDCLASYGPVSLVEPALPVLGVLVNRINTDCITSAGEITLGGSGGVGPYQFSLDGTIYTADSTFSNLPPGSYLGWVQDSRGCSDTINAIIQDIADPSLTLDSIRNVSCFGGNDGFVSVTGTGGTPGYLYSLDGGAFGAGSSFSNLTAGSYFIVLQDANLCEFTLAFEIRQPDSLSLNLGLKEDVDCTGNNSGSVFITATGGVAPYEYNLNGGSFSTVDLFENLSAGTYNFEVRDANACPADLVVDILEPLPLQMTGQATDVLCFGESSGEVRLSGSGGTFPYRYSFDNQNFVIQDSFINLAPGNYTYYIEDANSCRDSVALSIGEPAELQLSLVDAVDLLCFDIPSGSLEVSATGGTGAYNYSLDLGANFTSTPIFADLGVGNYTVIVEDANGCRDDIQADLEQPDELLGDVMKTDITCFGDSNGVAEATVSGGTLGYSFEWSTGDVGPRVTNLGPGNYIVAVTDNNGCQISLSTEIFEPPLLEFDTAMVEDVLCNGGSDGRLEVSVIGGLPPYRFNWSNGATDSIQIDISAGDYSLTVSDSNLCTLDTLLTVAEPDPIVINLVDIEPSFCDLPNGSITVLAEGGTPDYTYTWLTSPPIQGNMLLDVFGGTQGGPYTILVLDSLGCRDSMTFELDAIPSPVADFTTDFAPLDSIIIPGDIGVGFINLSQNANSYLWDFGDGGGSTDENPRHVYDAEGTYTVTLIAYDVNLACPDTADLSFTLLPPGAIYVPNAFSPNDDGINDNFFPKGVGVIRMKMDIFDRWGKHLTTLNSLGDRWPGTNMNGNPVQEGVYVWYIEATLNDGRVYRQAGTVTLFR